MSTTEYGWVFVGADARTSVPTVRMCEELMLVDCSLVADARTSVPTVRMCEELMPVDCSLVYGHRDGTLLPHVNNRYLS